MPKEPNAIAVRGGRIDGPLLKVNVGSDGGAGPAEVSTPDATALLARIADSLENIEEMLTLALRSRR